MPLSYMYYIVVLFPYTYIKNRLQNCIVDAISKENGDNLARNEGKINAYRKS